MRYSAVNNYYLMGTKISRHSFSPSTNRLLTARRVAARWNELTWWNGDRLDLTCCGTLTKFYQKQTSRLLCYAERSKIGHNSDLANHSVFKPIATEAPGMSGTLGWNFINRTVSKIAEATKEQHHIWCST